MKSSPTVAVVVIVITILGSFFFSTTGSDVRFFCASGRVFVEFEERGHTWGTMWLDDVGAPISCDPKIKTVGKETI